MRLTLGFSPCPNDTFVFDALVNGKIKRGFDFGCDFDFDITIADVEELNRAAFDRSIDAVKLSWHAYASVARQYAVCTAGGAMSRGGGPLLVCKRKIYPDEVPFVTIALPGRYTTAAFLLKYAFPTVAATKEYLFSDIEEAVLSGETDAGVLIHESRFTYRDKGLRLVADLGAHWESDTGHPVPLGCIAVNRSLPDDVQRSFAAALRESVAFAMANPASSRPFVMRHAQIRDERIIDSHIGMFVNGYTLDLGNEGRAAANFFLKKIMEVTADSTPLPEKIFVE
ncbi:MAG: 1,4-dihydroxy-6-naphthoate synthase [Prevotellaceae bacterium]|jgi:1,4-dihydroxy-6-naphthoate synthase|nr:1,4-dihydroxy-6-naphthoate synthase [Prevotellaceae bacterium]